MLYLNQAGTSWPKPAPVHDAVLTALSAPPETWTDRLQTQREEICGAFGVKRIDRLLLTPGATSALALGILDHSWNPGDRILISSLEHHALHRPVQQLIERGVEVTIVPPGDGEPLSLDALTMELGRGGVRMVAMTAASNVTGDLLPVEAITTLARSHGALSLIDAAQIAGWFPIDVEELDVDLLCFTGHKGPQAPWGIGGLYVAPDVTMSSPRAACELPADGRAVPCAPMPGFCDAGSIDRAALAGLVAGLRWVADPERVDRLERGRHQAAALSQSIRELPGVTIHAFSDPSRRMPTVAFTVEDRTPSELATKLAERGIVGSGGLQCAPLVHETLRTLPKGVLRLSFGPGNDEEDGIVAAKALGEILRED